MGRFPIACKSEVLSRLHRIDDEMGQTCMKASLPRGVEMFDGSLADQPVTEPYLSRVPIGESASDRLRVAGRTIVLERSPGKAEDRDGIETILGK